MKWYDCEEEKIVSNEEFEENCQNCRDFCAEGTIDIPCKGVREDCPYYKKHKE